MGHVDLTSQRQRLRCVRRRFIMFIASYIGGNLGGHGFITLDGCRFLKKRKLMKVSQQNIK
jgi:hypothetical protein